MVLESRITWEKLAIELELLAAEEPQSVVPLLIGIHSILRGDEFQDWCTRSINFMSFELATECEGKSDSEKLIILNEFFFRKKDFQVSGVNRKVLREPELLIRDVLADRSGCALTLALVYLHLAAQIDLPMALINLANLNIVKWMRGSRCSYLDLTQSGRVLEEDDLLRLISQQPGIEVSTAAESKFEILSYKKVMQMYLQDLTEVYRIGGEHDLCHAALSMLLKVDPNNLKYIGDRALLRRTMGFEKEALSDLKRYLSFSELNAAPAEIQKAFKEISAFSSNSSEVLH